MTAGFTREILSRSYQIECNEETDNRAGFLRYRSLIENGRDFALIFDFMISQGDHIDIDTSVQAGFHIFEF